MSTYGAMKAAIIYFYPLVFDATLGLTLFVNRHSLAEKGENLEVVSRVPFIYGAVYIFASFIMGKLIKPKLAKIQMLIAIFSMIFVLLLLANIQTTTLTLLVFGAVPLITSLFFNSFQSYALGVDTSRKRHLSYTVGHYTIAWSMGFAMGPFVSAVVKSAFSWSSCYYVAAAAVFGLGLLAIFINPHHTSQSKTDSQDHTNIRPTVPKNSQAPALPKAGWLGVLIALISWTVITVLWPILAEERNLSVALKGWVEFINAVVQGLSAVAICKMTNWYFRPKWLLIFAIPGIIGTALFALADSTQVYLTAAALVGVYMGSCFIYMVFHAMVDSKKSVFRIAVNEITVGAGFIIGAVAAPLAHGLLKNYTTVFLSLAAFITAGVFLQYFVAKKTLGPFPATAKSND